MDRGDQTKEAQPSKGTTIGIAADKEFAVRATRAARVEPINRKQMIMRTVDVDSLVGEDHPVRAIWELTGRLDLGRYYEAIGSVEGRAGRPSWDPRLMISLWIYAYSEGVSSAREIARLCQYDPAYQWLTGMQVINYHSLSDFRVEHREALNELFTQVLGVLAAEGLVTLKRVTHDGMKVKACASADTFRREERIKAYLELAREQVVLMEQQQEEEIAPRLLRARQRAARERVDKLELAEEELKRVQASKRTKEEKRQARVSVTDPQARIMKQSDGGFAPSYNLQVSTDADSGIIVGVGVSQSGADYGELLPAVERIEENLGDKPEQMVVDGGFISRDNIVGMEEIGVDLIGPKPDGKSQSAGQMNRRGVAMEYRPEHFVYDPLSDTFTCPAGKLLKLQGKEKSPGKTDYQYRAQAQDCRVCPFRDQCCPTATVKGRSITRTVDHPAVTAFIDKMETEEAKNIYRIRGAIAEFVHAWIKEKIGLRQFRLRGLIKAGIETLWACLTYNVQQWIRLSWKPALVGDR